MIGWAVARRLMAGGGLFRQVGFNLRVLSSSMLGVGLLSISYSEISYLINSDNNI